MRKLTVLALGTTLLVGVWVLGSTVVGAQVYSNNPQIALMDNCDAENFPPGICVQVKHRSDVGIVEFLSVLYSPLSKTVVGHPSWRMEPSYLDIRDGQSVQVVNKGADTHSFTEVVNFGGGFVPGLNGAPDPDFPPPPPGTAPLIPAPGCAFPGVGPSILGPGQSFVVTPGHGTRKFQCCIHPWMRVVVGVGT